jgi:histidinol-phosphate/aromatic aminotransferase/cobyric acid decarboxylase-like protein/choline kinase
MKAVILAAGLGSRLNHPGLPKPLHRVAGESIIARALRLAESRGVAEAVVVVGHLGESIESALGESCGRMKIRYVWSDAYRSTNNAYSLWLAREYLDDDLFLLDGDVLFEEELLERLEEAGCPAVSAVSAWRPNLDGTVAIVRPDMSVLRMEEWRGRPPAARPDAFKTVNIHLLRKQFVIDAFLPALDAMISAGGSAGYYEAALAALIGAGHEVRAVDCTDLRWQEVDDVSDEIAADIAFAAAPARLELLAGQHGSFWRHGVVDHALLVNAYFPPAELLAAMGAELADAVTSYPAGQQTCCRLVSGVVGDRPERLAVANGASELIKPLARLLGRAMIVVPNFNEYESVPWAGGACAYPLAAPGFRLDVADLAARMTARECGVAVLTSPGNPTGTAVSREAIAELCVRLRAAGQRVLLDESFVDFAPPGQSMAPELGRHPNLVIVKSLSKAYGVGGLRLGYLQASDPELVRAVRAELAIWNVNGVAESFLRLLPRFQAPFLRSCDQVRADVARLQAQLAAVPGTLCSDSAANFAFARLPAGRLAGDVALELFTRHRILVKDCSGKTMPDGGRWIRVASRTRAENDSLVGSLRSIIG